MLALMCDLCQHEIRLRMFVSCNVSRVGGWEAHDELEEFPKNWGADAFNGEFCCDLDHQVLNLDSWILCGSPMDHEMAVSAELERARSLAPDVLFASATDGLGLQHLRQELRHWPAESTAE